MVKRSDNYIEIGRVVYVNYGADAGKLATIIDIVDQARALIDGPVEKTGVARQTIPLRNLSLTPIKLNIRRALRPSTLAKSWTEQKAEDKWNATNWAKKLQKTKARASLSDFDRFKAFLLKKQRNQAIAKEASKLRKAGAGKTAAKKK